MEELTLLNLDLHSMPVLGLYDVWRDNNSSLGDRMIGKKGITESTMSTTIWYIIAVIAITLLMIVVMFYYFKIPFNLVFP